LLKHDPSAQMPWQNTMLSLVPFILLSFWDGCGEVNSFISRPPCAITPAATALPVVKRNWRRFGRGDSGERSRYFMAVCLTSCRRVQTDYTQRYGERVRTPSPKEHSRALLQQMMKQSGGRGRSLEKSCDFAQKPCRGF